MNNIYSEMLSSLPVPERLSPENIALMLEENSAAKKKTRHDLVGFRGGEQARAA